MMKSIKLFLCLVIGGGCGFLCSVVFWMLGFSLFESTYTDVSEYVVKDSFVYFTGGNEVSIPKGVTLYQFKDNDVNDKYFILVDIQDY